MFDESKKELVAKVEGESAIASLELEKGIFTLKVNGVEICLKQAHLQAAVNELVVESNRQLRKQQQRSSEDWSEKN